MDNKEILFDTNTLIEINNYFQYSLFVEKFTNPTNFEELLFRQKR